MKRITFALIVAGTACGGSSSKSATSSVAPDPVPMAEGAASSSEPAVAPVPVQEPEPAAPQPPSPEAVKADLLAAETAAFGRAKPVFEKWCAKCHSKDGKATNAKKREHFDMTTYPFAGHHAMEVGDEVREVLGLTGKKPTMPADKKGAVQGEELELIKTWAEAFNASHKGGAHEGHDQHEGAHKH